MRMLFVCRRLPANEKYLHLRALSASAVIHILANSSSVTILYVSVFANTCTYGLRSSSEFYEDIAAVGKPERS